MKLRLEHTIQFANSSSRRLSREKSISHDEQADMLFDVCRQFGQFIYFFFRSMIVNHPWVPRPSLSSFTIPTSSANLQRTFAICAKQDKCDGNCNAITKDKTHPLDFKLSSIRAHARACTSAVRAGAVHFRALTGGCGSYQDEWWLD